MTETLRALLAGIIDYAGIFPPAELPLEEAVRNHARYRESGDAWMLARFICPAGRLAELDDLGFELFSKSEPFSFSIVGRPSRTADEFLTRLSEDLGAIAAFHETHGGRVSTEVMEIRLPSDPAIAGGEDASALADFLYRTAETLDRDAPDSVGVFLEGFFPGPGAWARAVPGVVRGIATHNDRTDVAWERVRPFGYKVRTGGVTADAFPSCEQVALVIDTCRKAGVAFKATAGLHHPVRHFADSVQADMHGFLNVFVGAVLAAAHDLSVEDVTRILEERDPSRFTFDDETIGWGDWTAPLAKVTEVRRTGAVGYGSCSFDEPREDLQTLGLW